MATRLRRFSRAAALVVLPLAAVALYRVVAVYRFDLGRCLSSGQPAAQVGQPAARTAGTGRVVTFMSYNVEGRAGLWNPRHVEELARVIRELRPDVVALEEVQRRRWTSRFADQAAELARLTGLAGVFGASFREFGGEFGNAVLTRGRVLDAQVFALPSFGEPRSLLRCDVEVDGIAFAVFATHLASWGAAARAERARQAECLRTHLVRSPLPFVLAGDLNANPLAPELAPLVGGKLLRLCGGSAEVTQPLAGCRLDYLLVDARWSVLSTGVVRAGPSDHWPITARLELSRPAPHNSGRSGRSP